MGDLRRRRHPIVQFGWIAGQTGQHHDREDDGNLDGEFPDAHQKITLIEYIDKNLPFNVVHNLLEDWNLCRQHHQPNKIEPLA